MFLLRPGILAFILLSFPNSNDMLLKIHYNCTFLFLIFVSSILFSKYAQKHFSASLLLPPCPEPPSGVTWVTARPRTCCPRVSLSVELWQRDRSEPLPAGSGHPSAESLFVTAVWPPMASDVISFQLPSFMHSGPGHLALPQTLRHAVLQGAHPQPGPSPLRGAFQCHLLSQVLCGCRI